MLVVGVLEGVEVLVAGVVEVVVTGVMLMLETPKSGLLGLAWVSTALVMAVLELGVLAVVGGMLGGGYGCYGRVVTA